MRKFVVFAALAVFGMFSAVSDAALLDVKSTGESQLLGLDTRWTVAFNAGVAGDATVVTAPNPSWGVLPGSSWISNNAIATSGGASVGFYTFATSFTVPATAVTANVSFDYLFDNLVTVSLNNTAIPGAAFNTNGFNLPAKSLSINLGGANGLLLGSNTLTFTVEQLAANDPNPVGLNVKITSATWDTQAAIPEPVSMSVFAGLLGLGLVAKRRRLV